MNHKLSIVIPVLNEEKYIGELLALLSRQTFQDFETIVVDGKSTDKTIDIVKKFENVKLVIAPHKGVSYQRNLGATAAKSDLLLFLDADVAFDNYFLEKIITEFNLAKFAIACAQSLPQDRNLVDTVLSLLYNNYQDLTRTFAPEIYGWMILVKKSTHQKIHGFNEKLFFQEDADYLKRIVKIGGKFQILKSTKVYFSARRPQKEGRLKFHKKTFMFMLYRIIFGLEKAQKKIIYESGNFT